VRIEGVRGSNPLSSTSSRVIFYRQPSSAAPAYSVGVPQPSCTFEAVAEPLECVTGLLRRGLRADLHRDVKVGVPKDLHGDPGMYVQISEQARAGTPSVMLRTASRPHTGARRQPGNAPAVPVTKRSSTGST